MKTYRTGKTGIIRRVIRKTLPYLFALGIGASSAIGCGKDSGPSNNAPAITSSPLERIVGGNAYTYDVNASDVDGDILSYSLATSPAGMAINSGTGVISWNTASADLGSHSVSVEVSDGKGGIDTQGFNLLVHSQTQDLTGKLNYIIITDSSLAGSFQTLADWKTRKGVMTEVHLVSDVESSYAGRDTQEKIRNFLKAKKTEHSELEYVLLGGDTEVVPHRGAYGQATGFPEDFNIPCDLYFSDLDGTWDADGDSIFGEVPSDNIDMHPDLFVGRAPVNTSAEADNFVGKVLKYETGAGLSADYITKGGNNVLFCAEKLSATTDSAIAKDWINPNVYDFILNGFGLKRLYETLYNGGELEDSVSVMNALNAGHHIVNIYGHGGEDILQVGAGLTNYIHSRDGAPAEKDIRNLTNSTRPFILYSLGCMTNAFDNTTLFPTGDCIGEYFVLNPNGGAVASIGESRIGLYTTSLTTGSGISWDYDKEFFKSLFSEGKINLGKAFADSKEDYAEVSKTNNDRRWIQYCLNLLGDPEMPVWTDCLGSITAIVNPGSNFTEVTADSGGNPLAGANVSLSNGTSTYNAPTNSEGKVIIPYSGITSVTITKQDYIPYN
jgi:hypothetical protein